MKQRKRKGGLEVGETMEKVLRTYGRESSISEEMPTSNRPNAIGRKQRRRNAKLQKKRNKMKSSLGLSKATPKEIISIENSTKKREDEKKRPKIKKKKLAEDPRKLALKTDNQQEDRVISALEKKLYMNKRKGKKLPKSFVDAGLDYILDVVDGGAGSGEEPEKDSEDEFFSNAKDFEENIDEDILKDVKEEDSNDDDLVDVEADNFADEEDLEEEEEDVEVEEKESKSIITSGKYIPPAMRVKLSNEQEENMRKTKRRLKGLLNRLSDSNISGICGEIEAMYREGSRAIMHKALTETILEQFCTPDPIPESLLMENAMLMAVLCSRVGIEGLMHFYEVLVIKLNTLVTEKGDADGKASNNLLQLLGYLYQFKVIDCKVILDIFRLLIESFAEKDIELILEILNKTGFQLRKDDPESLRDIIKAVISKCEDLQVSTDDGSRMSFMMNILLAVKNNNIRKVTGYDTDQVAARRKKLATLTKTVQGDGSSNIVPPVTLLDFLNIEKNGRWWIVGSSFSGRPMLRNSDKGQDDTVISAELDESVSKKVAEAARMQRMNTDVRRKIFYAIMTADDFVDAFEKVMKCGLKGKQLREIANVIVDCCQQGKTFNAYYVHLLNRFCQHDRQFAISIQCTMWDRFKVLSTMKQSQMENIARLLSRLIIMEDLSLNCLKAIDFTEIDKSMIRFLRLFLCTLAEESSGIDHLRTIVDPLRISSKCKLVRQGLHLFLQYFMLSDDKFMLEHSQLHDHFQAMLLSVGKAKSTFL